MALMPLASWHGFFSGDMRAEIQQAVGLLKGEAENATATKNPIASKLLVVADNLQHVEKDCFFSSLLDAL